VHRVQILQPREQRVLDVPFDHHVQKGPTHRRCSLRPATGLLPWYSSIAV
jgi:hypothetical protein